MSAHQGRGPLARPHRHHAGSERQHRRIGQMEQSETAGEDHKWAILHQHPQCRRGVARMRAGLAVMSFLRIDLASAYHPERKECRHAKRSGNEKDGLVRNEITGRAHPRGSEPRADGSEACIAAKPLGYCGMANKPKANGGNSWSQDAACSRVQQLGR